MAFRVAARTVLELGAELISSDAVAIYELVKNAIDAKSADGVEIHFCIAMKHSAFVDALSSAEELEARKIEEDDTSAAQQLEADFAELKSSTKAAFIENSPAEARTALSTAVDRAESPADFRTRLTSAYLAANWIEFRDTGRGMSKEDLLESFLVIGTPSRRRSLDVELRTKDAEPRYLGEKGVGRLSAMRLGSILDVTTSTSEDKRLNHLHVDWSVFDDLDKMVQDIELVPTVGARKPDPESSGTTIRISGIASNWSAKRMVGICTSELARLSDPFSRSKRRFRIAVIFNGSRVDIPRLDRAIFELAHAKATGEHSIVKGKPQLDVELWCGDLGKGNPPEERRLHFEKIDLKSLADDVPASALRTVGPFSFEFYWYNRRLFRSIDGIGDRKHIQDLQRLWSGIMLFRNGYRVFPYGDDDNDWLGLDRKALASQGYKLNKSQFIGRVSISRTKNPHLIDQTSREGLKDCDEKEVFVELLKFVIQDRLLNFLNEVEERHQPKSIDFDKAEKQVKSLQERAVTSIKELGARHAEEKPKLRELMSFVDEMMAYFAAAKERAEQIEDERDRMLQLAGVGLMLEIVAHELARSTETTLALLSQKPAEGLPAEVNSLFKSLRDEMQTMNRRLRVLDPLSVSGRQRKETFDFVAMVRDVLAGHAPQFKRHNVSIDVTVERGAKTVMVHGVRGMFVQIIENLIQNSIYWMDLQALDEQKYKPNIAISIGKLPNLLEYTDNGPGIQPSLRDEVFKAFFSTKGKSKRQGLGLYIAADCAKHNGGRIFLSEERKVHRGRLNTFVLEIPEPEK
ncbi:MAG TPA: sensor histidine kinase [Bradyrhizobium sp.]|uniref:sensor histidine kinase n=1 Tax=Bradyrhizobium sp. CCH5-F6 TaxID=1768753 RepID=UPI000769A799|nr:sensor histidine kinase [Bradyrhizobium sp. CCH5-F6]HXH42224.1 sensor histidine kinase [Bradyrhizobium sp.]